MAVHRHVYDDIKAWSYVYFLIARETGASVHWVKIGQSRKPVERVLDVLTGLPLPVVRFGYLCCANEDTAQNLERELHLLFRERIGSAGAEWFRFELASKQEQDLLFDGIRACAYKLGVSPNIQSLTPEKLLALRGERVGVRAKRFRTGEAARKREQQERRREMEKYRGRLTT